MTAPAGSATAPASPETVEWFAGLFEPLAGLAIERGVKLPALIDSLKLALVRAATSVVAARTCPPFADGLQVQVPVARASALLSLPGPTPGWP